MNNKLFKSVVTNINRGFEILFKACKKWQQYLKSLQRKRIKELEKRDYFFELLEMSDGALRYRRFQINQEFKKGVDYETAKDLVYEMILIELEFIIR